MTNLQKVNGGGLSYLQGLRTEAASPASETALAGGRLSKNRVPVGGSAALAMESSWQPWDRILIRLSAPSPPFHS